ncbi:hypothetical protein ABZ412_26915 [Nocardia sp. NPDC005746]|uniref:WXG100-like domain-containing protein n=1 Tax=Nocardia sp. NPDC005746 TaxID=3157062 RepID=UPI0033C40594
MAALNFGMAYPKGDQDALFDLGDAWKKAAADLEKLEPDLKAVTGKLPQFYDSDGAVKVSAELATLFDGKDYSIQKLVECLNQLGHDTRATATEIEYAKIQSEIFALLTLYTVLQLSVTLFGEALVPEVLFTARQTLRIFAEKVMERIGLLRARAALETLAQPLLREIAVPLGEKLAAQAATKPLLETALKYGGKSLTAGLGAGAMGAGLDAGTQFIQILEGHRDDGFNLKQTFQTSLQWGVGGAVGAPFHAKVGDLLRDTRLPSKLGGAIAGGVGGGMGAVGMYGTGLGIQLYDNGGDWSKVDKTFHTELLIGGLAMGVGGGANHGLENGHGAPGDSAVTARSGPDGSAPHTPEPEVRTAGEQPEHSVQPEHDAPHDVHPAAATDQPVNHEPADGTTRERDAPSSEAPRHDLGTNVSSSGDGGPRQGDAGTKLSDAGTKPGDTGTKLGDTGTKLSDAGPKLGDPGTKLGDAGPKLGDTGTKLGDAGPKLGESSPKVSEPAAPRAGTPAAPAGEGPRATTAPTEHRGNLVSGTQDRAAPVGRTPEARPVEATSDTQTRATPTESTTKPEQSPAKPTDRSDPTSKSPETDRSRRDPEGPRPEDSTPNHAEQTPKEPQAQQEPRDKPAAEGQRENEHRDSERPDSGDAAPETPAPALVVTTMPGEPGSHEARTHSPDARDNSRARAHENSKPTDAQDSHAPADASKPDPAEGDWSPRPEDEWSHRDSTQVADELAKRWNLEVSGFDHPLLDPEVAREFARAIDDMLTRYPDVDLRKVSIDSIGDPGTYAATYEGHSPSGRMYTDEVVLDRDYALDPERMAREIAEDEADGHLVPGSADRPIHSTLVHEFGHVLAIESQEHAELTAHKALADHFEATRGGMDKDAFHEWLDQLSGYSFDENGRFDGPEAVAEAFTDVQYHGEGATEPARVLYHHLLDSARDHGSTPDGFKHRPDDAVQDPRLRKGQSPSPSEPNGERDGPAAAPDSPEAGGPSAPDVESYLEQPRVSAALDRADELGITTSIDGVDTPVSAVIRDLLPQHPELAEMLRSNEHLERSLLERPKTLASLLTHPDGLPVLHDAVKAVVERGPESALAEPVHIEPTPLTPAERAMSHEIRDAIADVPESSRRQPEFDYSRIEDPEYQGEFLRKQYDIWRASQDALNDVVRDIARETEGTPGWRDAPKDETRAWDKIKGYDGDVSRLTDLVGAKIVFDHVSDAYRALEMIENDPRVRIVEFEDRFDRPTPSGYRDLQMKVQLENGHIAELRLHLSHIDAVAKYEHALYEVQRDFKALAKDENRAMHPEEAALSTELKRTVSGRFWEATQQGLPEEHAPTRPEPPERRGRARSGIPDEPRDPGSTHSDSNRSEQPIGEQARDSGELTPELRDGFDNLRSLATEIDRAAADPARADDLTNLRERFAEQFDGLGLRDSENSGATWQLFDQHDQALSTYLAEYSGDFLPLAEEAAPGHEQLKGRFEQVRTHINDIFAATNDPARAHELPELRAKFGELVDGIGLRDQDKWGPAWQSFTEHDAALAKYVEQNHEHLLPRPEDVSPPAPDPIKPLPGYQGNFHRDARDIASALQNAGRPDLAQKFTDLVNREVDGGNVGGLEDWMGETTPRARVGDMDQVLDKAAELTELDRLSFEVRNDPELSVRFNPGVSGDRSFDILVERTTSDGSTTVERRVEIERMKHLPEQATSLHGAALHGADKAVAPAPDRIPSAETTVVMPETPPQGRVQPLGGGNERRFGANGWDYEIVDPNGNVRKTGNLLDELARGFTVNKKLHPNLANLDAVRFVDENGNLLGQIVREGDVWRKVQ